MDTINVQRKINISKYDALCPQSEEYTQVLGRNQQPRIL